MKYRANPIPSRAEKSPLQEDRRVMCAGYKRCLDEAVRKKWHGFSCRKCGAFLPLQFDTSELLLDTLACIALINVADSQSSFKQKPRGGIVRRLQHIMSKDNILG
jgi:hypothetical protein